MATPEQIRKRREEKRRGSKARERAKRKTSGGYGSTTVTLPDGVEWFDMQAGSYRIAILGYKVGHGNPEADPGDFHYERTYYIYKDVGPEKSWYVAPCKVGLADPVQEWRTAEAKKPGGGDADAVKAYRPKERQLFLIYDYADQKIKLWEVSYRLFGEMLDERINSAKGEREGWDLFYFFDEDGLDLEIEIMQSKDGSWNETTSIDFSQRETELPENAQNHGVCLDDLVIIPSYDKLKTAFFGLDTSPRGQKQQEQAAEQETQTTSTEAEAKEKVESKESKPDPAANLPKAADYGLKVNATVLYKGDSCEILKISGDGTSLTLERKSDEEILKGVGPDEVEQPASTEKVEEKPAKTKEPEPELEPAKTSSAADDDEWSF